MPPQRERLTKTVVEEAAAPEKGTRFLWDAEVRGFAVRLYRGNDGVVRRIYVARFSKPGGGSSWITIGRHGAPWRPDARGKPRTLTADLAREEALRLRGTWLAGEDPRAVRAARRVALAKPKRPDVPTLGEFKKRYLAEHSEPYKAASSAREDKGYLERHIIPALGAATRLDDIGPGEVTAMHSALRTKPTTANRCVEVIRTMINKAKLWKALPRDHENPCDEVPRFKETRRERYLAPEELARLGPVLAAEKIENPYGVAALLTLAFTGARPNEVLTLKWEQLRLDQGVVMIRRKGRWLPLYLPGPAVAVLADLPRKEGNPYVFPGRRVANPMSMGGLHTMWRRVRDAAQLVDVRPYDLRHTLASVAVNAGFSLEIIGGLLGHLNPTTTKRYAHLAAGPVREAGETAAKEIEEALKRR